MYIYEIKRNHEDRKKIKTEDNVKKMKFKTQRKIPNFMDTRKRETGVLQSAIGGPTRREGSRLTGRGHGEISKAKSYDRKEGKDHLLRSERQGDQINQNR